MPTIGKFARADITGVGVSVGVGFGTGARFGFAAAAVADFLGAAFFLAVIGD